MTRYVDQCSSPNKKMGIYHKIKILVEATETVTMEEIAKEFLFIYFFQEEAKI